MSVHCKSLIACMIAAVALAALTGCASEPEGARVGNRPPTVWLSSAPPEGNSTTYRIHLFWGGWDPDGEIAYYEYAITNNEDGAFSPADTTGPGRWHKVYSNDSTFTFSADELVNPKTSKLVSRFERSHTFFIRAVDTEGAASLEPAYRSFTAWTLSPEVTILVPRSAGLTPALVPSITTYSWSARDFVNTEQEILEPDSVRYILRSVEGNDFIGAIDYIRQHPHAPEWSDWLFYRAPNDAGKSWTTPPIDYGPYVFAVQAMDEAGAVTPVFDETYNVRRVRVSNRSTGPILDVYNEYIGTIRTSVVNTPTVIVDIPAGVPMSFSWKANADDYGGIVSGYRYGWDIADLDNPDNWEVDYTPFLSTSARSPARTFNYGTHTFNVEVIDNSSAKSRVEIKVNVVQFTMARNLLLVDDFNLKSTGIAATGGAVPSDAELDQFWKDMLDDVGGFSFQDDAIQVRAGDPVSIVKLADYKTIIWDAYGDYNMASSARPKLYDLIHFRSKDPTKGATSGKIQPNLLALFVKAGGRLMLCGSQPMTQAITIEGFFTTAERYPFVFKYELEGDQDGNYSDQVQSGAYVGDRSFPYRDACVNVLDIAYPGNSELRDATKNGCGVTQLRNVDPRTNGLREALPIDPAFPRLTLRPEVAGSGRTYAPDKRGLNAELYNPPYFKDCTFSEIRNPRACFEPVYGNGCLDQSSVLYNAPVAFWSNVYRDIVPEEGGTHAARNFFMGVEPYYFKPVEAKGMIDAVVFDEWGLPQN